jgi:hypothetical protein
MDKSSHYRDLIKRHLSDLAALCNCHPTPDMETLCAFDEERDHYLVLSTGWAGKRRERGVALLIRLRNGKIWNEEDWTEEGITPDLVKAGVPKEDIVLGFHPPEMRQLTEYAVA